MTITDFFPTIISVMPTNFKKGLSTAISNTDKAIDKMKEANKLLFSMAGKPNSQDCAKANKLITEALMLIK